MKRELACRFLGTHNYVPYKEEKKVDAKGNQVGIIMISRCIHCGKIKSVTIYTESSYDR